MPILATNTIEKINWTNYQDIDDTKILSANNNYDNCSLCANRVFAFEAYKVPFVFFLLGLPNQYHVSLYYIFSVLGRILVSLILAREIINLQISFSYEIGVDNNFLSYHTLSRNEQIRLGHIIVCCCKSTNTGSFAWFSIHHKRI